VFGDRTSGAYLVKHAWTKIVRHQMVKMGSSPDDPALAEYWAGRRRRAAPPPMDNLSLRLLRSQNGSCPLCTELLLVADHPPQSPEEWEQWVRTTQRVVAKRHIAYEVRGTSGGSSTLRLVHTRCLRRHQSPTAPGPQFLQRQQAQGLA